MGLVVLGVLGGLNTVEELLSYSTSCDNRDIKI